MIDDLRLKNRLILDLWFRVAFGELQDSFAFGELQVASCICPRQVAGCFTGVGDGIPAPPLFIEEVAVELTEEFVEAVVPQLPPPSGVLPL